MRAYNQSTWKKPVTWWYLYHLVFVWRFVGLWNPRLWGMVGWKMLKSLTRISMVDALTAIDQGGQVGHTCLDQRDATKYGPCGQGNKLRWKGDTDTGMATIQKDWKVGPIGISGANLGTYKKCLSMCTSDFCRPRESEDKWFAAATELETQHTQRSVQLMNLADWICNGSAGE